MNRLNSSFLLGLAIAAAAPAPARIVGTQIPTPAPRANPFGNDSRLPGPSVGRELRDVRNDIDRARKNGDITGREARQLRREARLIGRLAERYGHDGLSGSEQGELQTRARILRDAIVSR